MQLVQSNDRANRLSFKGALANKVEAALSAPAPTEPTVKDQTLLLPTNFESLSETDLHFTLMHNKELKHSRQSANLAVDIVFNKVIHPKNVTFQTVEITNPVPVPVFATRKPSIRGKVRPITGPDLTAEFKQFVQEFEAHRIEPVLHKPTQLQATILLPEGYDTLTEDDLHYRLTHSTDLAHSHESARFAIDILKGRMPKPEGVTFKVFEPITEAPTTVKTQKPAQATAIVQPREVEHRAKFKQYLADKMEKALATKPVVEELILKTVFVPQGYENMSDGELHFALIRNPELKHSQESARQVIDVLSGKIQNPGLRFESISLVNPQLAPVATTSNKKEKSVKPATQAKFVINKPSLLTRAQIPLTDSPDKGAEVILIPHNYEDMSETQLHFALSHNREYGHSFESVYEALDILYGRKVCPQGTVFSTVEVKKPVERAY